jgi:DNA-binding transcriptional MerR regulator
MGDTNEILALKKNYVNLDDVLSMMDAEESASSAASVELHTLYDPNTGEKKVVEAPLPGVEEEAKTKKQIQAAKNMEMLRRKKAEIRVALINKSIDEKIQSMKDNNFQRAQITAQISKDHHELMLETQESI